MSDVTSPIYFIDYSKISDTLMWLDNFHILKFNVTLQKANTSSGGMSSFHKEFSFMNKNTNTEMISISRDYSFYYSIEEAKNKNWNNSLILRPGEVEVLGMIIPRNIYPWYFSTTEKQSAFMTKDGQLVVKSGLKAQMPLNDKSYLEFRPIVIEFENSHEQKQGIRFIINRSDNYIDMSIDKFLEFNAYILRTDMLTAAMTMLNYVKTRPYGMNMIGSRSNNNYQQNNSNYSNNSGGKKGFF